MSISVSMEADARLSASISINIYGGGRVLPIPGRASICTSSYRNQSLPVFAQSIDINRPSVLFCIVAYFNFANIFSDSAVAKGAYMQFYILPSTYLFIQLIPFYID